MTPFTISPARCSPLVSVPEPAPSNPRCCLPSATTLHLTPAQPKKKKEEKNTHRSASWALMCSPLTWNPRITNLLYRYTTDSSTWVKTSTRGGGFGSNRSPQKLNLWVKEIKIYLNMEFILHCESKDCWSEAAKLKPRSLSESKSSAL